MKAPSTPTDGEMIKAQARSNTSSALSENNINMTNQVTPYGNLTYSQTGTRTYFDPALKKNVTVPAYTATTQLTPEQQHILEQTQTADAKQNDIALAQIDKIGGILGTPFQYQTGDHEAWAGNLYDQLNGDTLAKQQNQLAQQLANKGVQAGSAAYDDAMRNLYYGQNKGRNDFMLNSYTQGLQKALTERNQPINEITALQGNTQVSQPNFVTTPQANVNGVDAAGIMMANSLQNQNRYNATLGGLAGLGGSILGGWASGGMGMGMGA